VDATTRYANTINFNLPPSNRVGMFARGFVPARATIFALSAGMLAWEIAGRFLHYSFLPPFSNVVFSAAQLIASGQILGYLAASLVALFKGYALAAVCGVVLGVLMGRYRRVEYAFDLYIDVMLATPKIALVPVLFAIFGVSRSVQVAIVFLSSFFIIVVNTMSAVRMVDETYIEMAHSFGAIERQLFQKVLLPGALPLTLAGLRLGMGRAVRGMINGEMYIALFGLGALLRTYGNRFDAERVFAILLIIIVVALVCMSMVQAIGQRLTHWTEIKL
jgi:ABC-type nitrate/sulfonate/bicarbonate transport system permease component